MGTVTLTLASNDGPIEVEAARIIAVTPDRPGTTVHVAGADGRQELRIPVRESAARIRALLSAGDEDP